MSYDIVGGSGDYMLGGYDIVGSDLDLISGADDLDTILGASYPMRMPVNRGAMTQAAFQQNQIANRQRLLFQQQMAQAAAAKMARNGLVVKSQNPTKSRRQILPMNSTGAIAAGASAVITARPQTIAFKPQKLVIPSTIASLFTIEDIKVGNKSQPVQAGSIPGEAFLPTAEDSLLECDTVQTSQDFILSVTNQSGAAVVFRAAVFGLSAEQ